MAQKQISRFPLNEKFSGLSGHVPNYAFAHIRKWHKRAVAFGNSKTNLLYVFFLYISNNFSWIEVPKTPHKVVSFRANEFLEIASCSGVGKASQSVVVDLDEKVNTLTWQDQKLIEIDTGCHWVKGPNHIRLFLA